ncbi:MAG: acyl-CoA thioester hydrolase, partial [Pseudonocardiales bacterium]|nr:acyl-CoA thioester hydrolase [Pseudonocardiales bacterium]
FLWKLHCLEDEPSRDTDTMSHSTWLAPVRYVEADQQGIVFNAHYLTYCDEAFGAFCAERGLLAFAEQVNLVSSTLTWTAAARWGDLVEVRTRCLRVGRTSTAIAFEIRASGRDCCRVETTYVLTDADGTKTPIPDSVRTELIDAAS